MSDRNSVSRDRRLYFAFAIISVATVACTVLFQYFKPFHTDKALEVPLIVEAVLRDILIKHVPKEDAVYLSIDGEDPSPEFLSKLADTHRPIQNGSKFQKGKGCHISLSARGIQWNKDGSVDVEAMQYWDILGAEGATYHLEKEDGKWVIQTRTQKWVA
jgi:hypothetical protein